MKKIKIIKLSADWCAPCKALQPILKNILSKDEFKDIPFQEIDIDDDIFAELNALLGESDKT